MINSRAFIGLAAASVLAAWAPGSADEKKPGGRAGKVAPRKVPVGFAGVGAVYGLKTGRGLI